MPTTPRASAVSSPGWDCSTFDDPSQVGSGSPPSSGASLSRWRLIPGMREKGATPHRAVAEIAERQHGVVSQAQLLSAGLSTSAISRQVASGRLYRVNRGVYAVGHPGISQYGRWMAATLAYGKAAAVSHRSAAALWELLKPFDGPVDVALPGVGGRRPRKGIRLHRCPSLLSSQVTRRRRIPVTTPARTIADLRPGLPAVELRRAIRQAEVLGLVIGPSSEPDRTRSELEHLFLRLCQRHGLPPPKVNMRIGRFTVDFFWPRQGLVVETDGYRFHRGRIAFEDDHARELELRTRGIDLMRLSYRQVTAEPARVAAAVRDALAP